MDSGGPEKQQAHDCEAVEDSSWNWKLWVGSITAAGGVFGLVMLASLLLIGSWAVSLFFDYFLVVFACIYALTFVFVRKHLR